MSSRTYLVTEGVHDVAFLGKLLGAALGFAKLENKRDLDPEWTSLLPSWPYKDSLRGSVPVPSFYRGPDRASVALVNAQGITEIIKKLRVHRETLARAGVSLDAVGVVLDADSHELPSARFARLSSALGAEGLPAPTAVEVVVGSPRTGVFVLPGDGSRGTLEDLLLECAAIVYPTLGGHAARFVDGLDRSAQDFTAAELAELAKPAGRNKAVVAAMGAVLRPGKPIQASLEDHRWIEPRTLATPRVAGLAQFLGHLVFAQQPARSTP